MWSVNRLLLVSSVLCLQSLLACGGSSVDSHGVPDPGDNGESAGDSGSDGPHSAGAPSSAGGSSAGAGTSNHGSAGSSNPGPNGSKLTEIKTDAPSARRIHRFPPPTTAAAPRTTFPNATT